METPGPHFVLVVDDQEPIRQLIAFILERYELNVLPAATAAAALRLIEEHGPEIELAIIDMVMPGVSGLDLGAELSRVHPELRILYISGYAQSLAVDAVAHRSPQNILLKPFSEDALLERVRLLLANRTSGGADTQPRA